ncbi:hypothetical protein E4T47_03707 [Aureobasidium subglaciale]|nr:hypothetical protein E4T47_03707 [Aureobasidium subglaciale]
MAPAILLDDGSRDLAKVRLMSTPAFAGKKLTSRQLNIAQPDPSKHYNMPTADGEPVDSEAIKRTLETIPIEIKDNIFSNLLLGAKVKYSTNGSWPGYKYKFDTTIMRVSKRMKQNATSYLHSQNEFALIHSKFFAFEIDKKRFLPAVATGKAARTFANPAIEATITHLHPTLCACCNPQEHSAKDRVTHALFLFADLQHLVRELRMTYHMWPSKPIYVVSEAGVSPVLHIPVNVDTQTKVVWKINPSQRQDLTDVERRARQTRLLVPLDFPTGCGKKISIVGADPDIIALEISARILSVDAVGWDLYNLMLSQKRYLDGLLSEDSTSISNLIHSYTDLACVGSPLDIVGHWANASVVRYVNMHGMMISLCLMPLEDLDDEAYNEAVADSWQLAVSSLVLDCLFTVARLGLEDKTFDHLKDCVETILHVVTNTFRPGMHLFDGRFKALLGHYMTWYSLHQTDAVNMYTQGVDMLTEFMKLLPVDDEDYIGRYMAEDIEFLKRAAAGKVEARKADFGRFAFPCINFQGLLTRPRIHNIHVDVKPPRVTLQGWTTKQDHPKAEVAAHMLKFVDDFAKLKFEERTLEKAQEALDHGHDVVAFLNLPREPADGFDPLDFATIMPALAPGGTIVSASMVALPPGFPDIPGLPFP